MGWGAGSPQSLADTLLIGSVANVGQTISIPGAGANSEMYGAGTAAAGARCTVLGNGSSAAGADTTVIGQGVVSPATITSSVLIGNMGAAPGANANDAVVIGAVTILAPNADHTVAIGYQANVGSRISVAVGANASCTGGQGSVAVGSSATTTGAGATVVGESSTAPQFSSVFGSQSAVGAGANGIVVGLGSQIAAGVVGAVVVGDAASVSAGSGVAVGPGASIAAGASSTTVVGAGASAAAAGLNSVAIGVSASVAAGDAIAIGQGATVAAGHTSSIAIGRNATTTAASQMVVGGGADPITTVAVGRGVSSATTDASVTLRTTDASGGSGANGTSWIIRAGSGDGAGTNGTITLVTAATDRWQVTSSGNLEKQTLGNYILTERKVIPSAATPTTVTTANSRAAYTNEGAAAQIEFDLPTCSAGLEFQFVVQDTDGLKIVANAGDTINVLGVVSAVAGNVVSATPGATITLLGINATEWIATAVTTATWVVT